MSDCWVIFLNDELLFNTFDEDFANLNDVKEELRKDCVILKNIEGYDGKRNVRLIEDGNGNKIPEMFDFVIPTPS